MTSDEPVIHWLPQSLTEGSVTACGLDVEDHPRITWLTAQNEVTCKRCLTVRNVPEIEV